MPGKNTAKNQRIWLYEKYKGICQKCLKAITWEQSTRGHIIPRFLWGPNTRENLQLECQKCNNQEEFGVLKNYNVMTEQQTLVHDLILEWLEIQKELSGSCDFIERLRDKEQYDLIPIVIKERRASLFGDFEKKLLTMPWVTNPPGWERAHPTRSVETVRYLTELSRNRSGKRKLKLM